MPKVMSSKSSSSDLVFSPYRFVKNDLVSLLLYKNLMILCEKIDDAPENFSDMKELVFTVSAICRKIKVSLPTGILEKWNRACFKQLETLIDIYEDIPFTLESRYDITKAYLDVVEFCAAYDLEIPFLVMEDYNWKRSAWERQIETEDETEEKEEEQWAENDVSSFNDDDCHIFDTLETQQQ